MALPFSEGEFLRVFAEYNLAVWPAPLILLSAALLTLLAASRERPRSGRVVWATLALLWLWMGAVYHLTFFATLTKAAYLFGALFILQALLFAAAVIQEPHLTFRFRADSRGLAGAVLFAYALVAYPAVGHLLGHSYPAAPTFGLPCPTTIYTFGLLLWAETRVPARLVLIPLAWSVVGTSAAVSLGMFEDFGLTASAAAILPAVRNRRAKSSKAQADPSRGGAAARV